jgi:hypothetical protein
MRIAVYSFCFGLIFFLNTTVSYAQRDPGQFTVRLCCRNDSEARIGPSHLSIRQRLRTS